MGLGAVGALAIIVAGPRASERAREYILLSDALRLVRIFSRVDEAEVWLASLSK